MAVRPKENASGVGKTMGNAMKTLPEGVVRYGRSPEFTEGSIPESLQSSHRTNGRTWARIVVLEGRLRCRILEPDVSETELSPGKPGIVEPEAAHAVEPVGKVRFLVEFYR